MAWRGGTGLGWARSRVGRGGAAFGAVCDIFAPSGKDGRFKKGTRVLSSPHSFGDAHMVISICEKFAVSFY